MAVLRVARLVLAALAVDRGGPPARAETEAIPPSSARPFGPGERVELRISYARLLAGRATLRVISGEEGERPALQFIAEARSQGFFAWLLHFRVDDRTV